MLLSEPDIETLLTHGGLWLSNPRATSVQKQRAGETDQQIKALAAKSDDLNFIWGTLVAEEKQPLHFSFGLHTYAG